MKGEGGGEIPWCCKSSPHPLNLGASRKENTRLSIGLQYAPLGIQCLERKKKEEKKMLPLAGLRCGCEGSRSLLSILMGWMTGVKGGREESAGKQPSPRINIIRRGESCARIVTSSGRSHSAQEKRGRREGRLQRDDPGFPSPACPLGGLSQEKGERNGEFPANPIFLSASPTQGDMKKKGGSSPRILPPVVSYIPATSVARRGETEKQLKFHLIRWNHGHTD